MCNFAAQFDCGIFFNHNILIITKMIVVPVKEGENIEKSAEEVQKKI